VRFGRLLISPPAATNSRIRRSPEWRQLDAEGALSAVGAGEEVVAASEYRALQHQVRELQRLSGKKAVVTHLLMSFSQTPMHYRLGHRRLGGPFFRIHINFHHVHYSKDHLASLTYIKNDGDGKNTPFFLMLLATYFIFPLGYLQSR
jgi:hypothetical protein